MDQKNLLNTFTYYFLTFFENTLTKWMKYLEDHPDEVDTSAPATLLAQGASAIPIYGRGVSASIIAGDKRLQKHDAMNDAKKMIGVISHYQGNRDDFKLKLIKIAFEIFYSYEHQFGLVSGDVNEVKTMRKLGIDASDRLVSYILDNYENPNILAHDMVFTGIIRGKSKRNWLVVERGKKLILRSSKNKITTTDFFENVTVHVRNVSKCIHFANKNTKQDLGCRDMLPWENTSDFNSCYQIDHDECSSKHQIDIKRKDEYIEEIRVFITAQNPYDDMKEFFKSEVKNQENLLTKYQESTTDNFKKITNQITNNNQEFLEETERVKKYCVLCVSHRDISYNLSPVCAAC